MFQICWNMKNVFSTYVEVILSGSAMPYSQLGILHVCGGDPCVSSSPMLYHEYSPRMWR